MPIASSAGVLGSQAPDFELPGVDGRIYRLRDFKSSRALVVVFMCNHCPYVIATQGKINRLARDSASRGVSLIGINSNDYKKYPEDDFESMKTRAKEQGYVFPYLHDATQEIARAYGAVCTPEFFVYQNAGSSDPQKNNFVLKYLGRIDSQRPTKNPESDPTEPPPRPELAEALDEILAGRNPSIDQKPSMGCSIKWI